MTDEYVLPGLGPSTSELSLVPNAEVFRNPFTKATKTRGRGGEHVMLRYSYREMPAEDKRQFAALRAKTNVNEARVYARDYSYTGPSGSISVSELAPALRAANFTSETWQTITDLDQGIRVRRAGNNSNGHNVRPTVEATTVVGNSYCLRTAIASNLASQAGGRYALVNASGSAAGEYFDPGTVAHVTRVNAVGFTAAQTSVRVGVSDNSGFGAFTFFDITEFSLGRCLLVDNGFNALTYSEQFDNAAWLKARTTITANAATAPDGSTTADELVEDSTAASTHYVEQSYTRSSVAEFWTGSVVIEANTSQRLRVRVDDGFNSGGQAIFDASTGTITQAANDIGTGGELTFASMHDLGNGRYRCRVTTRLPASTIARVLLHLCDGATNTTLFDGDGVSGLYIWGGQLQRGGQLGRYVETTTAATTGTNQTGSEVWLKGLDTATDGQLKAGDQIEINDQLVELQSDLDGDESGVGLAIVRPRIRNAPSDEAPAVLLNPYGRFVIDMPRAPIQSRPGIFSDVPLDLVEGIAS